jgi:GWxTD domain-containing protein
MKNKKLLFLILSAAMLIMGVNQIFSQFTDTEDPDKIFYFDAVCFKSEKNDLGRVDAYAIVPYQTLHFLKNGDIYGAQYDINVEVIDSNGTKVTSKKTTRVLAEKDYNTAQGGTAGFDYTQNRFDLPAGRYTVTATMTDNFTKENITRQRSITIVNFNDYKFSISGILLLSAVEETENSRTITPHISDDVASLPDGFFAFFEAYNKTGRDSTDFAYQLVNSQGDVVASGPRIRQYTGKPVTQHYLHVKMPEKNKTGSFTLRVVALVPSPQQSFAESDFQAIAERSIKYIPVLNTVIKQDLNTAIKQLRYVATQSQVDDIESAATLEDKQQRFEDFWKALDPTPNTERNEAEEEYYARIEYANRNFRSYTEGWRTDKGMVYVIYGEPYSRERVSPYADGRVYERWTYRDNRQFVFVDNSGFGDFRLYQPMTINEKYRYGR